MLKFKNLLTKQKIVYDLFLLLFVLLLLFGRSFTGIFILGFRVGEWLTAAGLLVSVFVLLSTVLKKIDKYKSLIYINSLVIATFFYQLVANDIEKFSNYLIKSSSYIWLIYYNYLGFFIFKKINYENIFFKLTIFILPIIYIFQTTYYPSIIESYFLLYSDKFEYLKAGDVLLAFCIIILVNENGFKSKYSFTFFYLFIASLFAPYFLYASKGAFLAFLFIFIFQFKNILMNLKKYKFRSFGLLICAVVIFFSSTYYIYGNFVFEKDENNQKLEIQELVLGGVTSILNERNTTEIFASFYFSDGRLYSEDVTANWRLQIWQDVVQDLNYKNRILTGYGYESIIPAMDDIERRGTDGTNEHVHNYFINILARGGTSQLLIITLFHIFIVKIYYQKYKSLKILKFIIPAFIVSFFDTSMESVRFPILYYSF